MDGSIHDQVLVFAADAGSSALLVESMDDPNYRVVQTSSPEEAHKLLASGSYTLGILQVGEQLDLLKYLLSAVKAHTALIVLGERSYDLAVTAFRAGAVDYLHDPYLPDTLRAVAARALEQQRQKQLFTMLIGKVKGQLSEAFVLLRQLYGAEQPGTIPPEVARIDSSAPYYKVGSLTIGRQQRVVLLDGRPVKVTPIEYRLLCCLAATPGEVVTSRAVALRTHQYNTSEAEAMALLKSHVRNLRRKLPNGMLLTVRGMGLMLVDPESRRRDGTRPVSTQVHSV